MTDRDRDAIINAMSAMTDAISLWPAKHPAAGMVMGIQEASDIAYGRMKVARDRLSIVLMDGSE